MARLRMTLKPREFEAVEFDPAAPPKDAVEVRPGEWAVKVGGSEDELRPVQTGDLVFELPQGSFPLTRADAFAKFDQIGVVEGAVRVAALTSDPEPEATPSAWQRFKQWTGLA